MIHQLENEEVILAVDTKACEIAGFRRKDKDIEYMWDGDPKYWSNRNPILFPHVSSPKDKILNFKGEDHKVNNHGVCRHAEFRFLEKGTDYLLFELEDNEETYAQYPYHFRMEVRYTLKDNQVSVDYTVYNEREEKLIFGFGLHPAFNCPLDPKKDFSDYRVEFECEDVEGSVLPLSYELFERYPTYVIHDPKSRRFTLTDGENSVIMETEEGFRIFALWTPKAPFVCLEPWVNTLDDEPEIRVFENAKGNIVLDKGQEYRIGYRFAIV